MSKIRPSLPPQRHVKKESISCFIAYFPQFFPRMITPGSNINSTSYASLPNLHGEYFIVQNILSTNGQEKMKRIMAVSCHQQGNVGLGLA